MNDSILLKIDYTDYPNSEDFHNTIRTFLTDKKKILMWYFLLRKVDRNPDVNLNTIMKYVRFGLSFHSDGVNIRLSFEDD